MRRRSNDPEFDYSYRTISTKDFVKNCIEEAAESIKNQDSRLDKEPSPYDDGLIDISIDPEVKNLKYSNFTAGIKPMLLTSAIEKLLDKCCDKKYCENSDPRKNESYSVVKRNLVSAFVEEQGDINVVLRKFKTKSAMLSEYALLVEKYADEIIEDTDREEDSMYYIDPETKEEFFKELESVDNEEVIIAVRNRVSDAIAKFINKNTEYKLEIQDVLNTTQDKINKVDSEPSLEEEEKEELKESYRELQKEKINNIKNSKPGTVFEKMVYSMAEAVIKTPTMQTEYMNNNRLNMDQIMESCELMYTLLELANTSKMIDVDESYIKDIIEGL